MPKAHQFEATPVGWPTDAPARRSIVTVTEPDGTKHTLRLTAGELRSLVRTALVGLGYTKITRPWHGKQAGWENRIMASVTPAMKMIEGFFPKSTTSTTKSASNAS